MSEYDSIYIIQQRNESYVDIKAIVVCAAILWIGSNGRGQIISRRSKQWSDGDITSLLFKGYGLQGYIPITLVMLRDYANKAISRRQEFCGDEMEQSNVFKHTLEQLVKVIHTIRRQRNKPDAILKVASLGYADIWLNEEEAKDIVGEEKHHLLRFRYDRFAYHYGIRTTRDPERIIWAEDVRETMGYEIGDVFAREKMLGQYGQERFLYDAFSLFSALDCYCEFFDLVPAKGFETTVDLNEPIDPSFHNKYDIVIDWGVTEHIFNVGEHFKNCFRLLKPAQTEAGQGGGVMMHFIPWEPNAGNYYRIGLSGYRVDPGTLRDFYLANECKIIDASLYCNQERETIELLPPDSIGREYVGISNKEHATIMNFIVQKTTDIEDVRIPIQRLYDVLSSLSHIFTWSPLLYDKSPRKADAGIDREMPTLHPNQSFLDSLTRSLKRVCTQKEVDAILEEKDYLTDPESLQDKIEEILKIRVWEEFERMVAGLRGMDVFYRIIDADIYEKRKPMFSGVRPKAVLTSDESGLPDGLTFDGLPVLSYGETVARNPQIPVVVFAGRKKMKTACLELRNITYPWPKLNLIPCWL